ncbi:MAG: presqualene diphosphate synthase HpnD [Mariprofundales bacterium]
MTAAEYCEQKTRGSGSSFFYAFLFLSADKRRAMMALYAFCREVDDIADDITDSTIATQKLNFWQDEIQRCFSDTNKADHPVAKELAWARESLNINFNAELFIEIIDGMRMDVNKVIMRKTSDLELYCYRVASVVGLLSIEIFGYQDRHSRDFAIHLGRALQLTNILRDVAEDAERKRIYLPEEWRTKFNVNDELILTTNANSHDNMNAKLLALLEDCANKAEESYEKALKCLPICDQKSLMPSLLMGNIYHAHLTRLRKNGFNVWQKPVRLSPIHKIWIAWRSYRLSKHIMRRKQTLTWWF